jgi:protein-S-isoprenylcysteine O-methyltransferase Ste14
MDKLVVIFFACAWGGVEIYSQMQERRRRGSAPTPADRGSLIVLYACITVGYSVAFAVSCVPDGRLPVGQPFWLVVGAAFIAGGLWIRRGAMATLAAHFTYQVEIQADHRLVEEGLCQRVRHGGAVPLAPTSGTTSSRPIPPSSTRSRSGRSSRCART